MADSSEEYDEDYDEEYHSDDNDEDYDSNGSLDSIDDSDLEYTESESTTDSYVYPWPTSSDDSWADISSDEVIQKILLKLPQYPAEQDKGDNSDEEIGYQHRDDLREFMSDHSNSFIERNDDLLNDLQERAAKYHNTKGITETDYQQFMNDVDLEELDDMDEEFLLDRYPMAMDSQLTKFIPDLYLAKVELYEMYLEYEDSTKQYDAETESDDVDASTATMIVNSDRETEKKIEAMNKKESEEPESAQSDQDEPSGQAQSDPPEEEQLTKPKEEEPTDADADDVDGERKDDQQTEQEPAATKLSYIYFVQFAILRTSHILSYDMTPHKLIKR